MAKKVLLIGSGGREHALAWKLAQSPGLEKLFVAPGNGGMAKAAEIVPIPATDFPALIDFAKRVQIDVTVVGPDDPLALGIVDAFQAAGLRIWGPSKFAAQLESSKAFAKELMARQNIPTAWSATFSDYGAAAEYVRKNGVPIVVKADGLALGKGVFICQTVGEAEAALQQIMVERQFGDSGNKVVIEEFLTGQEISIHAFCDGTTAKLMPPAQDHKAIFDGDKGPNTGGMGSIAPVPWVNKKLLDMADLGVVKPALEGMRDLGHPFVGCLFPGLIDTSGGYRVLEFNGRFGDPETQSYMRLLETDLLDIIDASIDGRLEQQEIMWSKKFACCVVLASAGYPGKYEKGLPISGIDQAEALPGVVVFHAGTELRGGKYFTNGGRVLGVSAVGDTLLAALDQAYAAAKLIHFDGMQYRNDIGVKALRLNR
jgi:phosphoribosylamine--glycine ligase